MENVCTKERICRFISYYMGCRMHHSTHEDLMVTIPVKMICIKSKSLIINISEGNKKSFHYTANPKKEIKETPWNVIHSKNVSQTTDNTQCNCDAKLLWLSYTFKEPGLIMVFIINTLLPNILKKSSIYYQQNTHTASKQTFAWVTERWRMPYSHVPFRCLCYSTTAPSSLRQQASSTAKITITKISLNRLTRQPQRNTENRGKELRGTSEVLIPWSLKALVKVTSWHVSDQHFIWCHHILISALGTLFLEVPYLAFC